MKRANSHSSYSHIDLMAHSSMGLFAINEAKRGGHFVDFSHGTSGEGESYEAPLALKEKLPPSSKKKKILIIGGPTAVGKSDMAIELAKRLGGEIISADSVQVYRGMDIGTAKVTKEIRLEIPHHLIDICDLSEAFNVARFYELATELIEGILSRGHVPIVVGGTGYYLHTLIYGPPLGPPSEPAVRKELSEQMEKFGHEALYDQLKKCDPQYAATITPGDRNKIIRALEIIKISKRPVTDFKIKSPPHKNSNYSFHCWFVYYPREILYPRIEMRCDQMIAMGLLDEVKKLINEGLKENSSAAQAIGYRQCLDYIESGEKDFEAFVANFKRASRRYAKRQFTWFNAEPLFEWLNLEECPPPEAIERILDHFIFSL